MAGASHLVEVGGGEDFPEVDAERLVSDGVRMLRAAGLEQSEWSIQLVAEEPMAQLNQTWRDKPGSTDVLSFPQQAPPVTGGVLGDVVLCVPVATRQSREQGHLLETELRVLLAHGLAHLLGEDHQTSEQAAAMSALEARLLADLGLQGGLVGRGEPPTP